MKIELSWDITHTEPLTKVQTILDDIHEDFRAMDYSEYQRALSKVPNTPEISQAYQWVFKTRCVGEYLLPGIEGDYGWLSCAGNMVHWYGVEGSNLISVRAVTTRGRGIDGLWVLNKHGLANDEAAVEYLESNAPDDMSWWETCEQYLERDPRGAASAITSPYVGGHARQLAISIHQA